jgi:uncharacterized membrane protein YfcA
MDGLLVASGALTGFIVGMTGVGGGALMTPILLLGFGTAPVTAVGTDLWFAAITKLAVSGLHVRRGLIDWPIVRRLWMGSLPASALALGWMARYPGQDGRTGVVRSAVALAVCLTAATLLTSRLRGPGGWPRRLTMPVRQGRETVPTIAAGGALGALVTLTSVGAGALGAVALVHLYPTRLTPVRLVATDIAHAVPLALCAGAGYLAIGEVDGALLRDLLAGSIPAALLGAALSSRVPQALLRVALGLVLLAVGLTMIAGAR